MQSDGGDDLERASNVPQDDSHPRTPRISQDQEPSVHAIQSDNDDTPSTTSDDSADEGHSSPFHVSQDNNQNQQPEAPRLRRRRRSKRKTMGMHRPEYVVKGTFFPPPFGLANLILSQGSDPFDYEQKFPEDRRHEELGPMARVWRTYLEESGIFDLEMVEGWRDGLDVLLVFVST